MIIFIKENDAYLRWLEENPNGFVVNTKNPPTPDYLILHLATCGTISSDQTSNWTTNQYLKVCSNNVDELTTWAKKRIGGALTPCQLCKPAK